MGLAHEGFGSHELLGASIGSLRVVVAEDGRAMILEAGDKTCSGERIGGNENIEELLREIIQLDSAEANGPIRSVSRRRRRWRREERRRTIRMSREVLMRRG